MQLLRQDHADRWPCIDYSRCRHTQISTLRTQQSTNITLKAAAANLIRSSSRMDEGQAGGSEGGVDDDGMSAHYHCLHGPVLQLLAQEEVAH